jgi:hypothetical protein
VAALEDGVAGSARNPSRAGLTGFVRNAVLRLVADRAAVLLLGVAVGAAIGGAFVSQGAHSPAAPQRRAAIGPAAAAKPNAQAQFDSAMPFSTHLLQTLAAGQQPTVAVFGDSFGVGVWAALDQMLRKNYHVIKFSKESTGFTRYASLNLEDEARQQIAGQPIDIAVIDFGANDTQGIYDGNHAYPLLSDGWKRVYGGRMDRFVNQLRQSGAMVYWVGLPVMRKPDFDRQITDMGDFYNQRMTALGVPYIGVKPLSVDEHGDFNEYLADGPAGSPKLMRANDGIHMTFAGYERIATPVVARINDYVARARVAALLDAPPPPATTASATQPAPAS